MNPDILQVAVPLGPQTTLQVGGQAEYFFAVTSLNEVVTAGQYAKTHNLPWFVLGGGSNVLIADSGVLGVTIKMQLRGVSYKKISDTKVWVTAAAGEPWDEFVASTIAAGYAGLENLSGIPGTVGAAPVQNINAYGVSVANYIVCVEVYDPSTDSVMTVTADSCGFGYRTSRFKASHQAPLVITAVTFELTTTAISSSATYHSATNNIAKHLAQRGIEKVTPQAIREAVLEIRGSIGMLEGQYRSAGSFFKNTIVNQKVFAKVLKIVEANFSELSQNLTPWYWKQADDTVKISTAFLLECSPYNKRTYKTEPPYRLVGFSPLHSLSLVTEPGATATLVVACVKEVIQSIENIFDITIETEVDYIT